MIKVQKVKDKAEVEIRGNALEVLFEMKSLIFGLADAIKDENARLNIFEFIELASKAAKNGNMQKISKLSEFYFDETK